MENTKAIKDSKEFFADVEKLLEVSEDNSKLTQDVIKFPTGKKLFLEVVVKDPQVARYLIRWLYRKDGEGEPLLPFGCLLETIHFNETTENIKSKLHEFIDSL